jgi:hypothetical protein
MAKIFPSDWRSAEATGAAQREIETLALLERALPDAYTVYHGVHWTRVGSGFSMFGEIEQYPTSTYPRRGGQGNLLSRTGQAERRNHGEHFAA